MNTLTCQEVWEKCLNVIKDNVSPQNFKTWFEPIQAIDVKDKTYASKKYKHFIGLAYIKDYNLFWSAFKHMKKNAGEYQVIEGFKKLIEFKTVKENIKLKCKHI